MSDVRQWSAPGRVNLIGEHLDYNGGPVLPIAIDRALTLKARLREDDTVRVWTTLGGNQTAEFTTRVQSADVTGWASYVAGVFWALARAGHPTRGADLVIDGDLPSGAGLSSSAAVEGLVATALNDLLGLGLDPIDLAILSRRAENDFVGAPTGIMDQVAVLTGRAGHALLIDSRPERPTVEAVEASWLEAGLSLVVIDTMTRHDLSDGSYAERRDECQRAADVLGLAHLAEAGPDAVLKLEDETLKARTRHVITETARVRGAVRALRARNWTQFGSMLSASHASLKEDFAVSRMELDIAQESAVAAGALGARMTGAGFGGSVIALVDASLRGPLAEAVTARFAFHQFAAPAFFAVEPAAGARELVAQSAAAAAGHRENLDL